MSSYDVWASEMTEDVAHFVQLAREADGPIVELMVGTSRVAVEVEALYGWFDRRPFADDSNEMVWITRKAGARSLDGAPQQT